MFPLWSKFLTLPCGLNIQRLVLKYKSTRGSQAKGNQTIYQLNICPLIKNFNTTPTVK